jgi:hypothetical protein
LQKILAQKLFFPNHFYNVCVVVFADSISLPLIGEKMSTKCMICAREFANDKIERHVNLCLDGRGDEDQAIVDVDGNNDDDSSAIEIVNSANEV